MRFGGIPWCLVRCFQGVFSGGLWYPTGFRGCAAWSGAWGWCVRGKQGFRAGPQASCAWVVFWGVWVYIRNPRERGARPGVLVTVNAAACYSPTSSRVQYHRRARP